MEAACYFSVFGAQPLGGSGHLPHLPVSTPGALFRVDPHLDFQFNRPLQIVTVTETLYVEVTYA